MDYDTQLLCRDWFHGKCPYCGERLTGRHFDLDHFIPRSQGGSSADYNLLGSCPHCNRSKGADDPIAWVFNRQGPKQLQSILDYFAVIRARYIPRGKIRVAKVLIPREMIWLERWRPVNHVIFIERDRTGLSMVSRRYVQGVGVAGLPRLPPFEQWLDAQIKRRYGYGNALRFGR